jgi:hypothetical protein
VAAPAGADPNRSRTGLRQASNSPLRNKRRALRRRRVSGCWSCWITVPPGLTSRLAPACARHEPAPVMKTPPPIPPKRSRTPNSPAMHTLISGDKNGSV